MVQFWVIRKIDPGASAFAILSLTFRHMKSESIKLESMIGLLAS